MAPGNRKPFSGKQKKQMLKQKREQKAHKKPLGHSSSSSSSSHNNSEDDDNNSSKHSNRNDQSKEVFINPQDQMIVKASVDNAPVATGSVQEQVHQKAAINDVQHEFTSENIYKINAQPDNCRSNRDVNRYALQFYRESDEQIRKCKMDAAKPYVKLSEKDLEIDSKLHEQLIKECIDFPKRPAWKSNYTKQQLLANEYSQFRQYLASLERRHGSLANLSYFEMNLETWRQLWRTLEMSDIVLLITDIRYSVFHFPNSLYEYIRNELNKEIVLVLNKCDLIPAELVLAWVHYWKEKFPSIHVIPFASYGGVKTKQSGKTKGKRYGKFSMASESVRHLYDACDKIVNQRIDISDWKRKIEEDIAVAKRTAAGLKDGNRLVDDAIDQFGKISLVKKIDSEKDDDGDDDDDDHKWNDNSELDKWTDRRKAGYEQKKPKKLNRKAKRRLKNLNKRHPASSEEEEEDDDEEEEEQVHDLSDEEPEVIKPSSDKKNQVVIQEQDYDYHEFKSLDQGVLTIGCIGHPNVGKSSVLNAIIGEIVVSVSRTPGHTKHFQTIFLTKNVRLCDCPGLVFPSKIPKQLQILMGCFPIAQLREPYSAVRYIAERLDLIQILKIKRSEDYEHQGWSAMEICEQWAVKRGYYAAKSARPDVYRAANQILRMALDGRTICLTFYPPDYSSNVHMWEKHPDLVNIRYLQRQLADSKDKERTFKSDKKLHRLRMGVAGDDDEEDRNSIKEESDDELYKQTPVGEVECP